MRFQEKSFQEKKKQDQWEFWTLVIWLQKLEESLFIVTLQMLGERSTN